MKTAQEINELYTRRHRTQLAGIAQMRSVRDQYNGDILIPLPQIDRAELPAVANILSMGLDQTARRIASTIPDVWYPPTKPGQKASEERSRTRRRATLGWWELNKMRRKLRRRSRYLIGYSNSPVILLPDLDRRIPKWEIRNPLAAYPCPSSDPDNITPTDCIFTYQRPYSWLQAKYPGPFALVYRGSDPKADDLFTLIEYHDDTESVLCIAGKPREDQYRIGGFGQQDQGVADCVVVSRVRNPTNICPVVMPQTINLDKSMGLFDGSLGMYQTQAKLMAIAVQGAYREILPETWAVSRPNEAVQIVVQPDPLQGVTGEIKGGDIKHVTTQGSQTGMAMIDRLERNQRVQEGVPAEFGGESASNIRTGRRGDAVLSATVDFTIQECQEILADSMEEENRRAIAISRHWFGNERKMFWVNWEGSRGQVDYVPNDIFAESDRQTVRYTYAGADANNFVVSAGQRLGLGTMSRRTFMQVDPLVPDAEQEHDYVLAEALEQAVLQSIQSGVADQSIPITDAVRIAELAAQDDISLIDAVNQAQKEAQKRQASSGQPGTPTGPVDPNAPPAQPGLNAPGAGGEAATVQPPGASMDNLAMMLRGLRKSGTPPPQQAAPVV